MSNTALQQAVQSLANLRESVQSSAPELLNEYNHLVTVGNQLAAGNPSASAVSSYGNAVQNFSNVLASCDDTLKLEIISVAEQIVQAVNYGNPAHYITPGAPGSLIAPYQSPCSPGQSCSPQPATGIYWTGIFILAGSVAAAVLLGHRK